MRFLSSIKLQSRKKYVYFVQQSSIVKLLNLKLNGEFRNYFLSNCLSPPAIIFKKTFCITLNYFKKCVNDSFTKICNGDLITLIPILSETEYSIYMHICTDA